MVGTRRFTKKELEIALENSTTLTEVIKKLGLINIGSSFTTVKKAAKNFAVDISKISLSFPGKETNIRALTTDNTIKEIVAITNQYEQVLEKLNLINTKTNMMWIGKKIKNLKLDISHFTTNKYCLRGPKYHKNKKRNLKDLLIENSILNNGKGIKERLYKECILIENCYKCGITHWEGQKLSLHIDHINGIRTDWRIENLRILCPNCHSLTATYCRGSKGLLPKAKKPRYKRKNITTKTRVKPTKPPHKKKIEWPSIEWLKKRLEDTPYTKLAKELGVSDNAIRHHIAYYDK